MKGGYYADEWLSVNGCRTIGKKIANRKEAVGLYIV